MDKMPTARHFTVVVLIALFCGVYSRNITLGVICDTDPNSWQYLFGIAGAINIAIDQLIMDGVIQNDTISK